MCWLFPDVSSTSDLHLLPFRHQETLTDWPLLICRNQISSLPAIYFSTSSHLQAVHGYLIVPWFSNTDGLHRSEDGWHFCILREMFRVQNAIFTATSYICLFHFYMMCLFQEIVKYVQILLPNKTFWLFYLPQCFVWRLIHHIKQSSDDKTPNY